MPNSDTLTQEISSSSKVASRAKKKRLFTLGKRHKFVISVVILSVGLFTSEFVFTGYVVAIAFFLALLTDVLYLLTMRTSSDDYVHPQTLILPFLCSLAFSLFFFLTPARLLSRIILTTIYAISVYSLFLSENIFTVASIRTIALLNGARIVSFVLTIISYFFLTNTLFSFHSNIFETILLLTVVTFLFVLHAVWTYSLEKSIKKDLNWTIIITLCMFELGVVLWFWPTSSTVVSLFLSGVLYIFIGLSHAWLDKRLFRGVFLEYLWVAVAALVLLIVLTQWQ